MPTKVLIKKTKTKTTTEGRLNHKAQVFAGNGQFIMGTPPRQHYYNLPELKEALVIAGKALVYEERETIHNEMKTVFENYCKDNNLIEGSLDVMHLAMDLILKNFNEA